MHYKKSGFRILPFLIFFGASASAQQFNDWELRCGIGSPCSLSQTLVTDQGRWLATLRLFPVLGGRVGVSVMVELGAHLPSGIFLIADPHYPTQLHWTRCDESACEARTVLDEKRVEAWRLGRTAKLVFRPSIEVQPVSAPISLLGVTAGLGAFARR